MVAITHTYSIIILSLILIFAIIHLGVGSGIIAENRSYGDMFRPEIGLAAYNIVISFIGLVVGIVGLCSILTHQSLLSKIVAVLSGILGIFTLVSLITALIINAKAADYVNNRFYDHMNQYDSSLYARDIIDHIQTNYKCCGEIIWFDWGRVQSATITSTTTTTTPITAMTASITTTKNAIATIRLS